MNKRLLLKTINYLRETKKATFIIEVSNREKVYKLTINKDSVNIQIIDKATSINELSLVNCDPEVILAGEEFKILSITENIYTLRNELYSSTYYNCIDYTQVYLPLFRVLGDQVVCLVRNPNGKLEKMFYINGRVFMFNRMDDVLQLDQTGLRKILGSCKIVDYEKLGRKYSYSTVFSSAEQYCKKHGLKLEVNKFGVSCP